MSTKKLQKEFVPGRGYSKEDWDAVDSPELTDEQLAQAKPFAEVFPDPEIVAALRQQLSWTHLRE